MSRKRIRELQAQRRELERTITALDSALLMSLQVEKAAPIWFGARQLARVRDLAAEAVADQIAALDAELKSFERV